MRGLADKRVFDKMKESGITFTMLAQRLRLRGHNVTAIEVFDIARKATKAPKQMQNDIADILGCLRKDIF